jgi:hypothetical protein
VIRLLSSWHDAQGKGPVADSTRVILRSHDVSVIAAIAIAASVTTLFNPAIAASSFRDPSIASGFHLRLKSYPTLIRTTFAV